MKILVLNSGSSSIKYKVFRFEDLYELRKGEKEEIEDHITALNELIDDLILDNIIQSFDEIKVVGHRVVHGGNYFDKPTLIDEDVMERIGKLSSLAPLHNPANLAGIKAIYKHSPRMAQVAVFDTEFHQTIPEYASRYPLPYEYFKDFGMKRYGFHGTSHSYVAKEAAKILGKELESLNLITIHLGNGSSVCAIEKGKSIDTSMGFTPLEGLMMGTRCGDIDTSLVFYMRKVLHISDEEIEQILNTQSGLKGVCGISDLREIEKLYKQDDPRAKLAIEMFVYRIVKYIGAYMMVLKNVDAIVLTGGIGEHSSLVKDEICKSTRLYNLKTLRVKTNEELEIAKLSKELIL